MKKVIAILCSSLFFTFTQAQEELNENKVSSKWSIHTQMGMLPIKSENTNSVNSYQGSLGIGYDVVSNFDIGIFFQTLIYMQNEDLLSMENKIMDMSSVDYHSIGISMGYKIDMNVFYIQPRLNVSYDIFNAKAIDYAYDNNNFLDYKYISLNPQLHLGFNLNEYFSIGTYGGYNYQIFALKGEKTEAFDPSGVNFGLKSSFYISR